MSRKPGAIQYAGIPITAFLLVCAVFVLVQRFGVDLIRLSYDACHYLHPGYSP
ncbi:TPA: hypothetical protein ACNV18_002297 [Pseudomonas putida]|uniref:Uncharacterized protein n=1 Tax=Pseudomonas putida TaxID=303 RepID=A0A7Y7ZG80_PSEPU|nr:MULTISPECIES: hypothetical protein [Pseudomonas]ELS0923927.1 hypothetical protein [Pseudomonas putida]MBH8609786.1 hypothetical protein [Pseudomonas mohnii]MCE1004012.1 hypothetical protein [Pseudomonas sp. NMI1173_11]MDF3927362.1 hypothetical protein [Pseudomonas putida]MDM3890393.1 hypothetical protein [Pseudomonas juntendi]